MGADGLLVDVLLEAMGVLPRRQQQQQQQLQQQQQQEQQHELFIQADMAKVVLFIRLWLSKLRLESIESIEFGYLTW